MSIKNKISRASKIYHPRDPEDLAKKIKYSKALLDKGILKKNTFDLPQIDTLGKSYYCDIYRIKFEER